MFADCTSITTEVTLSEYESFKELAELLAKVGLKKSRAEARREIDSGAVYLKD
jgi:tyrosyl-tRNA synthetase